MKTNFLFTLLLMLSGGVFAQKPEPVLLNVVYLSVHVSDTNNPDKPFKEEMLLQLGAMSGKYIRNKPKEKPKPVVPEGASAAPAQVVVGRPMAVVNSTGITDVELFQHPEDGSINVTASVGSHQYIIKYGLPKIDWKIYPDTRKIGDYNCQKAVGEYAGRKYTAWFAPELAFQRGPWKLSGLPGLILEAEDEKKQVQFLFREIGKDTSGDNTGTSRRRLVSVTAQAYEKAREAFLEDPVTAMQAQLPAGAPPVTLAFRDASGKVTTGENAGQLIDQQKKETKLHFNNPIELKKP